MLGITPILPPEIRMPFCLTINNGDKVAFEIFPGPKGPNANITLVLEGVSER